MKKLQFLSLFEKNIENALQLAEKVLNASISRNIEIELHGAEYSGLLTDVEKAVDILYLGEDRFYRIIDVGVKGVGESRTRVFVGVSGHEPARFDETWDIPPGNGPFKPVEPVAIIKLVE